MIYQGEERYEQVKRKAIEISILIIGIVIGFSVDNL
tara:strand:+ start:344 stop:451 length:108 start_codon:yes stop_codon:yes gene_type:complete